MKSTAIVCAIAAASMGFASLSYAQGYDRRGPGDNPQRYEQRGGPQEWNGRHDHQDRRFNRNDDRSASRFDHRNARNDRHFGARGPQFHRGGYIPREYRSRQYVVNDWRAHRLSAPPRGQQWVQVGADYALIAIATGLIAQLVLNH
ncbi:MAG TPA: RcnB family protein [Burkholderiaceae bacterium]